MSTIVKNPALEKITRRLEKLEEKVAQVEDTLEALAPHVPDGPWEPLDDPIADKERVLALLRARGLISDPGPHIREGAARWEALSAEEKREHREFMDLLQLDPPLSQIVLDNRR